MDRPVAVARRSSKANSSGCARMAIPGGRRACSLWECRVHPMCEDRDRSLFSREKRRSITQDWLHFVCKHIGFVNFQIIDMLTGIVRPHPFVDRFSQSEGGIAISTHLLRA